MYEPVWTQTQIDRFFCHVLEKKNQLIFNYHSFVLTNMKAVSK